MRKAKLLLTLAAAAAVVSTAAVSFAQWDTLSASTTGTITLDKPITVAVAESTTYNGEKDNEGYATYTGTASIIATGLTDEQKAKTQLELVPQISSSNGQDVTDNFTVSIAKSTTPDTAITPELNSATVIDNSADLAGGANNYTIKITPKDTAKDLVSDATKDFTVTLTAKLGDKTTA